MTQVIDEIRTYLIESGNPELAELFCRSEYVVDTEIVEDLYSESQIQILTFKGHSKVCQAISYLPQYEIQRIINIVKSIDKSISNKLDTIKAIEKDNISLPEKSELILNLLILKSILTKIGIGEISIQDCEDEYKIIYHRSEKQFDKYKIKFSVCLF